jgi:hypothetical protein
VFCQGITLPAGGYLWIGYLPQSDLAINTALANIAPAPTDNDRFIGQTSFATFYGTSWIGSLTTLQKGYGYICKLAKASVLTYPSSYGSAGSIQKSAEAERKTSNGDVLKNNLYHNMQLIGQIIRFEGGISVNPGDEVYAYVGNECRGIGNVHTDLDGRLFLTIGSDIKSGETVSFKVYDSEKNKLYTLEETIDFASDKEIGTMERPYLFNLTKITRTVLIFRTVDFSIGDIYPNPFTSSSSLEINLEKPGQVDARIYNSIGQEVQLTLNQWMESGKYKLKIDGSGLTPGFYNLVFSYRNDHDKSVITRKMVIQ